MYVQVEDNGIRLGDLDCRTGWCVPKLRMKKSARQL